MTRTNASTAKTSSHLIIDSYTHQCSDAWFVPSHVLGNSVSRYHMNQGAIIRHRSIEDRPYLACLTSVCCRRRTLRLQVVNIEKDEQTLPQFVGSPHVVFRISRVGRDLSVHNLRPVRKILCR